MALLLARWSRSLARLALSTDEYRSALGGMGLFGSEPWELPLEAGLYRLEDDAGHAIAFDHGGEEVTRVEL